MSFAASTAQLSDERMASLAGADLQAVQDQRQLRPASGTTVVLRSRPPHFEVLVLAARTNEAGLFSVPDYAVFAVNVELGMIWHGAPAALHQLVMQQGLATVRAFAAEAVTPLPMPCFSSPSLFSSPPQSDSAPLPDVGQLDSDVEQLFLTWSGNDLLV